MTLRVSTSAIQSLHHGMAKIGKPVGVGRPARCSTRRLAYRSSETKAHDWLAEQLTVSGGHKWIDPIGNTFIDFPGSDSKFAPIVLSSHLDTVFMPGHFDGVSGCVAGVVTAKTLLRLRHKLRHPLRVAFWRAEESTRFKIAMLGSKWFYGQISTERLLALKDDVGITIEDEMRDLGLRPERIDIDARNLDRRHAASLELHIEQGEILEQLGKPLAIVTSFKGTTRAIVRVYGTETHTGTTAMHNRQDPVPAAGEMVNAVRSIALRRRSENLVASTGKIESNGSMNQTASGVWFTLDIRDLNSQRMAAVAKEIRERFARIATKHKVRCEIEDLGTTNPVWSSPEVTSAIASAATKLGWYNSLVHSSMPSGAGHDAVPPLLDDQFSGLIFARSGTRIPGGARSHSWTEIASYKDLAMGTELMLQSVIELDEKLD